MIAFAVNIFYRMDSTKLAVLSLIYTVHFLAPLAKGQRAIVMALCPLCVRPCVRP